MMIILVTKDLLREKIPRFSSWNSKGLSTRVERELLGNTEDTFFINGECKYELEVNLLKSLMYMHLDETKYCFICGPDNPLGLKMEPYLEDENVVVASYIAPNHLCGYNFKKTASSFKGIVHGGILSSMLDCLGGWVFYVLRKKLVVTTEFNVKFLKPVFVGEKMYLRSEMLSEKDDIVTVRGEIRNNRKELCTVSEIKYKILSEELLKKFIEK